MSIHDSRLLAAVCLLVTLSSYGCEKGSGFEEERIGSIRPSQIGFNGIAEPLSNSTNFFGHGVTLQPAIVTPEVFTSARCPTARSFAAPVRVVVVSGDDDVFLNQVDVRFVDRKGVSREATSLTRANLVDLFGSTVIPRRVTRVFPLTLPFGCTADVNGTLAVAVFTGNSFGAFNRKTFEVDVR